MATTQITIRIPDDLVDFVDALVGDGRHGSRAEAVAHALRRYRQRLQNERDALVYAEQPLDEEELAFDRRQDGLPRRLAYPAPDDEAEVGPGATGS